MFSKKPAWRASECSVTNTAISFTLDDGEALLLRRLRRLGGDGTKPSSFIARSTLLRVCSETLDDPATTLDTVAWETPASSATCVIDMNKMLSDPTYTL
jgi:hypothetical protein